MIKKFKHERKVKKHEKQIKEFQKVRIVRIRREKFFKDENLLDLKNHVYFYIGKAHQFQGGKTGQ